MGQDNACTRVYYIAFNVQWRCQQTVSCCSSLLSQTNLPNLQESTYSNAPFSALFAYPLIQLHIHKGKTCSNLHDIYPLFTQLPLQAKDAKKVSSVRCIVMPQSRRVPTPLCMRGCGVVDSRPNKSVAFRSVPFPSAQRSLTREVS